MSKMYFWFRYLGMAAFGGSGGLRIFPNRQLDRAGHVFATAATANEERAVLPFHLLVELCARGHEKRDDLMLAGVARGVQETPQSVFVSRVNVPPILEKILSRVALTQVEWEGSRLR